MGWQWARCNNNRSTITMFLLNSEGGELPRPFPNWFLIRYLLESEWGEGGAPRFFFIENSKIRKFENSKILKFENSKSQQFEKWTFKISKFKNSKIQKSKNSTIKKFKKSKEVEKANFSPLCFYLTTSVSLSIYLYIYIHMHIYIYIYINIFRHT